MRLGLGLTAPDAGRALGDDPAADLANGAPDVVWCVQLRKELATLRAQQQQSEGRNALGGTSEGLKAVSSPAQTRTRSKRTRPPAPAIAHCAVIHRRRESKRSARRPRRPRS